MLKFSFIYTFVFILWGLDFMQSLSQFRKNQTRSMLVFLVWIPSAVHCCMSLVRWWIWLVYFGKQYWTHAGKTNKSKNWLLTFVGVHSLFGVGVGKSEWFDHEALWSLSSLDGQDLGQFKGVVASDKSTFSSRFKSATGRPPPIGM